ncbi:MAG: hypothetical protein K1X57_17210, partial [Gemmataceae bacterium]|nr:hypothetical protein [Gemmataceae bacterium]
HYSDSGGKSGGQKEKLAYTILAASLAYQFGLDKSAAGSRDFLIIRADYGRSIASPAGAGGGIAMIFCAL